MEEADEEEERERVGGGLLAEEKLRGESNNDEQKNGENASVCKNLTLEPTFYFLEARFKN